MTAEQYQLLEELAGPDSDWSQVAETNRLAVGAALEEIRRLRDALSWCSGSPSFAEGGEAYLGWLNVCAPLLDVRIGTGPGGLG